MSTLAAYRARLDAEAACDHTRLDCHCRECECRGVWCPKRDGYRCVDSCAWMRALRRAHPGATELAPDITGTCPRCDGKGGARTDDGWWVPCLSCSPDEPLPIASTGAFKVRPIDSDYRVLRDPCRVCEGIGVVRVEREDADGTYEVDESCSACLGTGRQA